MRQLEQSYASLKGEIAQRDQTLSELRDNATRYEQMARDYATRYEQVSQLTHALHANLDLRQRQLRDMEAYAAQQAEGIEWLRQEVLAREARLAEIYGSRGWWTLGLYWRARAAIGRLARVPELFDRRALPPPAAEPSGAPSSAVPLVAPNHTPGVEATAEPALANDWLAATPRSRPTTYDVICFSIVDWDFRWQRPQQLMSQFADAGHRVFFVTASRFQAGIGNQFRVRPLRDNVWEVQFAASSQLGGVPH